MRRLNIALAAGVLAVGALSGAEAGSVLWQGVRGAYSGSASSALVSSAAHPPAAVATSVARAPEPQPAAREQAELARALNHALALALLAGL
jgi:hypothetical protein